MAPRTSSVRPLPTSRSAPPGHRSASSAIPSTARDPSRPSLRSSFATPMLDKRRSSSVFATPSRSTPRQPATLSEQETLELQLLQWQYANWRFGRTKAEQGRKGLDQLHALLEGRREAQRVAQERAAEAHRAEVMRAVAGTLAVAGVGDDLAALQRLDRLHQAFATRLMNVCNTLPTSGVSVPSEAALLAELQEGGRVVAAAAERLRPLADSAVEMSALLQEMMSLETKVESNLTAISELLRAKEHSSLETASRLIGDIQEAEEAGPEETAGPPP